MKNLTKIIKEEVEKLLSELKSGENKSEEAFVDCLSNHFSSRNQFGVKFMEDVLQIISLDWFFGVEEFQEFLHELRSHVNLQRSNLNCFVDDKLQEKLIDTLQMWPGWLDFIFGFDTSFRKLKIGLLEIRQWSKYVLLDHGHDIVQVRNDETDDCLLVL